MATNKKPLYQPWNEEEFNGDIRVSRGMNWLQRHFYRALLQATFFCSTRPYLPAEDADLWMLADAESQKMWEENKGPVLAMFHGAVIDGRNLLENKRVSEDWERLMAKRDQMEELGERRAASAVRAGGRFIAVGSQPATSDAPADAGEIAESHQRATSIDRVKVSEVERREEKPSQVSGTAGQDSAPKKCGGNWHVFAVKYKQVFGGKKAGAFFKGKFADACLKYGEDTVLGCFDEWAPGAKEWAEDKGVDQPLHAFFKKLGEMADDRQAEAHIEQTQAREAEQAAAQAKQVEQATAAIVEASIARQKAEDVAFMTKTPPPQNECHPFDIIPPADDDHSPYAEEWRAAQKGAE